MIFFPGIPYLRFAKWAGIGAIILGLGFMVMLQRTTIARQVGTIKEYADKIVNLNREVSIGNANLTACARVNAENNATAEMIVRDHAKSTAVLSDALRAERERKNKVITLKQVIHEEAKKCAGVVPPAVTRAITE